MPEVAKIWLTVGADTKEAEQGLERVQRKTHTVVGALTDIGKRAAAFGLGMAGIRAVSDAFSVLSDMIVGFNGRMEQSRIAWTTMLGSATAAEVMLRDLQKFAAETPFEFPELEDASRRLVAMGFAARDVIPLMTDIGNAAAGIGKGKEGVNRLVLALGQMQAKAKVSAEEMLQMTELGIPAWDVLAKAIGKSVPETMKLAEQGKIASGVFIEAFRQFSRQNFGDMMEQQSRTFLGSLSTIKDNLLIVAATGFKPLFERLSALAQGIAQFVSSQDFAVWGMRMQQTLNFVFLVVDRVRAGIGALGNAMQGNLPVFAGIAGLVGTMTANWLAYNAILAGSRAATLALAAAQAALNLVLRANPLTLVLSLVAGLASALITAYRTNEAFRQGVEEVWQAIQRTVGNAVGAVTGLLGDLWGAIQGLASGWAEQFASIQRVTGSVFQFIGSRLSDFFNWLRGLPIVGQYIGEFGDWVGGMGEQVSETFRTVQSAVTTTLGNLREEAGSALGGLANAAGTALGQVTGAVTGMIGGVQAAWEQAQPPLVELPTDIAALTAATQPMAAAMEDAAAKTRKEAFSAQELVNALVALHPAVRLVSLEVESYRRQIDSLNLSLRFHQDQLRAAQGEYQAMQEQLSRLKDSLSEAQRRLQELSSPRLKGMGEFESKISAIETQLKRLQLAELMGKPLEEISKQFPMLEKGSEEYLRTLPKTREELQKILEQLRLSQSLTFDEQLKKLKEAAEGAKKELTFEQALTQIQQTKTRITELTGAVSAQEAALRSQQAVIASVQATIDSLNATLQQYQAQLAEAQRRQELVTQALQLAYTWLLEGRQKFTELGAEGERVAGVMDQEAATLLSAVTSMAADTSTISSETLAEMVKNYQVRMATALLEVGRLKGTLDALPRYIETLHVTRHVDVYGGENVEGAEGRQQGGPIYPGRAYLVGERGPELIVPAAAGTVVPLSGSTGIDYERLAETMLAAMSRRPTYVINANYRYQDERSLRDDLRLLQLLGAAT